MKTTVDLLSPKERREYTKAGKVRVYNMNDIMSYKDFSELDGSQQKNLLEHWRSKYPNDKIIKSMNISKNKFYELVRDFELKTNVGPTPTSNRIKLTKEQMEFYKRELPDYEEFKKFTIEQQNEIFLSHLDKYKSSKDFANVWGVNANTIYSLKYRIKKQTEKKNKKKVNKETLSPIIEAKREVAATTLEAPKQESLKGLVEGNEFNNKENTVDQEIKQIDLEIESQQEKQNIEITVPRETDSITGMSIQINEQLNSKQLYNKLIKIANLVEEENSIYKVKFSIEKVGNIPEEKEDKVVMTVLEQIARRLKDA